MQRINKSHIAWQTVKDTLKTNKYPEDTVSDDLQVLKLALDAKLNIKILLYSYEREYQEETKKLLNSLIEISKEAYEISDATYDALALKENHAGIIATIELPRIQKSSFNSLSYLFVLDHLEIPGNVGTIYRTLDSCACDGVILVDPITKLNNPKITSSSRGCNLIIPTLSLTYQEALVFLEDNGYTIYLGEPELGKAYQDYDYQGKIAFVVGNERFGIQSDWYQHPHKKVFIPMEGHQNSLNVSVAASILAYEAYMKRKKP